MKHGRTENIRWRGALIALGIMVLMLPSGSRYGLLAQEEGVPEAEDESLLLGEEDVIQLTPSPSAEEPNALAPSTAPIPDAERVGVRGEAREGETRWNIDISGTVIVNYAFTESPDNFIVKYRFDIKGQANAATAVIRGNADINAVVEGPLSKWPTGECRLEVMIPKVPYELTFKKTDEERGNIKLVFKKVINEEWQSKCSFTDIPTAKFDTRGPPETWLGKALDKARPPLKDIVAKIGESETTSSFVINKETISDAPLGSGEIEGMGQVTIKRGGPE